MIARSLVIMLALCTPAFAEFQLSEFLKLDQPAQSESPPQKGLVGYVDYLSWQVHKNIEYAREYLYVEGGPGDEGHRYTHLIGVETLDVPRNSGMRTGVGYRFESGWEVSWNYTNYFAHGEGGITVNSQEIRVSPEPIEDYLNTYLTDSVQAAYSLSYNVHDLEVSRWLSLDDTLDMRLFGGFRWANIEQDYQAASNGWIYDNPEIMKGYGIRLGLESRWLPFGGVKIFGRGAGTVLAGNFHDQILGSSSNFYMPRYYFHYQPCFTQAVPVLEAALGVSWQRGPWEVSGGYELNTWFNLGRESKDLLLEGFYLRLAFVH